MKYNTYLFDLDGVLVNTDKIHYDSLIESIFQETNILINNNDKINNMLKSTIPTLEKLNILFKENIINEKMIENIYNKKKEISDNIFLNFKLDTKKIELMKYLNDNNYNIGVITNTNKKTAEILLEKTGIFKYINILITNENVVNKKPSPEPYLKAIHFFNSDIKKTIIFEDSEIGILSAKNTNCDYFIVKNTNDLNIDVIKYINNIFLTTKFIAHRGNLYGPDIKNENKIDYILNSIEKGFDCEIDIRYINNTLYLGHDNPDYIVDISFLKNNSNKLWIHCKNVDALEYLIKYKELNIFWHQNDDYVLTSKDYIWSYPGKEITQNSVVVMPEINNFKMNTLNNFYGICSDYVGCLYKN